MMHESRSKRTSAQTEMAAFGFRHARFIVPIGVVAAFLLVGAVLYGSVRSYVLKKAERDIENMLLQHRGVHQYVQDKALLELYALKEAHKIPEELYSPALFSSSYMVRNMHQRYNEERVRAGLPPLYYKLAAENPRNPVNMADGYELRILHRFNQDPSLREYRETIELDGEEYLYVAIPFLRTEERCLKCHGNRTEAPADLQAIYPGEGGFGDTVGNIRAIESLRAPLDDELGIVNLVLISAAIVCVGFAALMGINGRLRKAVAARTAGIRKKEVLLKNSEAMAHIGSWEYDLAADRLQWSDEAYRIFGVDPKSFTPSYEAFMELALPDDRHRLESVFRRSLKRGATGYEIVHSIKRPCDGEERIVREKCVHTRDASGNVVRSWGMTQDITDRSRAEEAAQAAHERLLQHQRAETELAHAELDKLRARLVNQTRLATIGQVAASIAHELRNPLGAVRNAAYILKRDRSFVNSGVREYLDLIDKEVNAADLVIRGMLEMAKSHEPEPQRIDLSDMLKSAKFQIPRDAGITCSVDIVPEPFFVYADPQQLKQVVSNLVTNAIHAMGISGRIVLTARREGDWDVLTVQDTGPGVSPQCTDQLFEPLFTTKAKGTGLGLTICRQIIERHGGTIDLVLEDGAGACFRIRLPHGREDELVNEAAVVDHAH